MPGHAMEPVLRVIREKYPLGVDIDNLADATVLGMRALSRDTGLSGTEKREALIRALRMCADEAQLGCVIDKLIPAVVTSIVHAEKGRLRLRRRRCCC